jgi:hypothetical protein
MPNRVHNCMNEKIRLLSVIGCATLLLAEHAQYACQEQQGCSVLVRPKEAAGMALELENISLPEQSEVKIELSVTAKLNISDVVAQRKVSRLLLELVGNLLYGERPNLVAGKRLLWRIPIWLGFPTTGPVGQVGTLDVDAQTGEILYTQQDLDEIEERGHALAQRTASAAT